VPSHEDELERRGSVFESELTGVPHDAEVSWTSITVPMGTTMVARLLANVTST
jgi:hypothetical protein